MMSSKGATGGSGKKASSQTKAPPRRKVRKKSKRTKSATLAKGKAAIAKYEEMKEMRNEERTKSGRQLAAGC